jgi:hypothetical protein
MRRPVLGALLCLVAACAREGEHAPAADDASSGDERPAPEDARDPGTGEPAMIGRDAPPGTGGTGVRGAAPAPPAAATPHQERTETGRVAVVGNVPFTRVVLGEADRQVELTGPLAPEIGGLAGAVLLVRGPAERGSLPGAQAVRVEEYRIRSVDGEEPLVGRLEPAAGELWLVHEGRRVRVTDPPADLRDRPGALVWLVGTETDEGMRVRSYGIIRPAP